MIRDISFQGSGCTISKASASMMTASVKGKTKGEAESLFDMVHRMLTGEMNTKRWFGRAGKTGSPCRGL